MMLFKDSLFSVFGVTEYVEHALMFKKHIIFQINLSPNACFLQRPSF